MWLSEQHPSYQIEKKSKMYDPKYNGGIRYPRTKDGWKADWHNSGTPIQWIYHIEQMYIAPIVPPWNAYLGK